uniref:Putative homing endonuclease n=1 Tax=viral metagenome TaxID=1070528 RepID=A0A6M3KP16_9ZZZZ
MTKLCKRCGTEKPVGDFNNDSSRPDGLWPWCKVCLKAYRGARKPPPKVRLRRVCTICGEEKLGNAFRKHMVSPDGTGKCRKCTEAVLSHEPDPTITEKRCSKCKETKAISEFSKAKQRKSGYSPRCKECDRAYYEETRDRVLERGRERRSKPGYKERYAEYAKDYASKNKDVLREKGRDYREKNKERRWKLKNRDKVYASCWKRRSRKLNAPGSFTLEEWNALKKHYVFTCLACGKKEPEIKLSPDHVVPLSKGGSDFIENIQPLCAECNGRKMTRSTDFRPDKVQASLF